MHAWINITHPGFSGCQEMPDDGDEWVSWEAMARIVSEHNERQARNEQKPNFVPDYTGEGSAWVPPVEARETKDPWESSKLDYDRSIHSNRDAKAWADFFVATYPGLADKHDIMLGWFANAMMAMHDSLKQEAPAVVVPEVPMGTALQRLGLRLTQILDGHEFAVLEHEFLNPAIEEMQNLSVLSGRVLGDGMRQIDARRFARMQAEEAERPYLLELERYVRTMARLQNWSKDTTDHGPLSSLDRLRANQGGAAT